MLNTLRDSIDEHAEEMLDLLERIININSYSANTDGVDLVGEVLAEAVGDMGYAVRRIPGQGTGDHVVAENGARQDKGGGVLMVGHMDTVFPPEMGFDTFRRENGRIYGPGVNDMKGGLVVGILAARALAHAGVDVPIGFFFNADEEIGSPHSRSFIAEEAKKSDYCLVMESSRSGGEVVVGRKGRIMFDLMVEGKPSHAGQSPFPKPSAIVEIAHKITALEALNDPEAGTSLNIGLVEGGVGTNTVAPSAKARVETRFLTPEKGEAIWNAICELRDTPQLEGTSCRTEIVMQRPTMMTNDAIMGLYTQVEAAGAEIGMDVTSISVGGGSDANIIAEAGIPVVDGLGTAGGKIHTPEEFMVEASLQSQALLTAATILRLHEQPGALAD